MQLTTTVKLAPKTQRLLTQFGDELRPAIIVGMELVVQAVESEVVQHTPVDQGTLRASIHGRTVDLWPQVQGIVGSPLSYAEPIEFGTRPFWPPTAPIQAWVHRKFGLSGTALVRTTFLVRRAISKRGLRAHGMFAKGARFAAHVAPRIIGAAADRVARSLSDR